MCRLEDVLARWRLNFCWVTSTENLILGQGVQDNAFFFPPERIKRLTAFKFHLLKKKQHTCTSGNTRPFLQRLVFQFLFQQSPPPRKLAPNSDFTFLLVQRSMFIFRSYYVAVWFLYLRQYQVICLFISWENPKYSTLWTSTGSRCFFSPHLIWANLYNVN